MPGIMMPSLPLAGPILAGPEEAEVTLADDLPPEDFFVAMNASPSCMEIYGANEQHSFSHARGFGNQERLTLYALRCTPEQDHTTEARRFGNQGASRDNARGEVPLDQDAEDSRHDRSDLGDMGPAVQVHSS
jgi:hypothetical protein